MGKLGKPGKATDKKKPEDDEIDFPLEEISLAMYRKKMEERKRKMPPEDGTKMSHTCRKKIKLENDLVSSGKKDKYPNNNPDGVVNSGKKKNLDIPEEPAEHPNFNNLREKLRAHKVVQYLEDSSSQQDDTADDSDYYPSSQASQDSLIQMGMKRIESIYKVEERRKEKMDTSSRVIKQEPKVEERRKEKIDTSPRVIKQEPKVEERRKEKMDTSSRVIKQEPKVEERRKEKMDTSSRVIKQEPNMEERRKEKMDTSSKMIKQEPKVEERRKEKMDTSSKMIKQEPKVEERRKEKMDTSSKMIKKQKPKVDEIAVPEVMESDDNSEELEGGIFWKELQTKMLRCKNFAKIAEIVDNTKLPDISLQRKTTMQPHDRKDRISQFLLPEDVDENLVPVMCKDDGNCLLRAISHLCFGTECRHREIRCRMAIDAVKNISDHLNNEKLYTGAINRLPNLDIMNFYAYIVPA